jgi:predicted ATPase/DNA-binding winged helix-turn-helix (wHTH) protein
VIYESSGWEVDLARRELRARGIPVPLGKRAFQIFAVLVQSAGQLVTKDELMARVWPSVIVEENTLEVHISAVRKALGSDRDMLKTSFGRGYRLVGDWTIRNKGFPREPVDLDPSPMPVRPFLNNVPAAAFELIGRNAAVRDLQNFLSAYRAITLTGPGGIGKTALALEVTRTLFPTFAGDCWLVDLASLSDTGLVPSTVAGVLGLKLGDDKIFPEAVARAIGGKKLLFVLDNCEHVIDAAARLAEAVIRLCPNASIVATSREVLRIQGEHVFRVPPLDVPSQDQEEPDIVLRYSAVQLFIDRARALDLEFSPHGENLRAIAAICRRLDGIPLAIEFAAARAAMLGPKLVHSSLDKRFELLTGGHRTALPRHQTLRATLDWSYELLPESERVVLRRLSVFAGAFTLDSAVEVVADTNTDVVESVANLIAKSLVSADVGATVVQYRLLDTTRAYATQKLTDSGELQEYLRRHALYHRDLFQRAETDWAARSTAEWRGDYGRRIDDVRRALSWAFSPNGDSSVGVALTVASIPLWMELSLMDECRERIERVLASQAAQSTHSDRDEMMLLVALGRAYSYGPLPENNTVWAKALQLAESLGDGEYQVRALSELYVYRAYTGDCREAIAVAQKIGNLAGWIDNPVIAAVGDCFTGAALLYLGDLTNARRHVDSRAKQYVTPFQRELLAHRGGARSTLSIILWIQGFPDQAISCAQSAVDDVQALDNALVLCSSVAIAACPFALYLADLPAAERWVAMLLDVSSKHGLATSNAQGRCLKGALLLARGDIAGLALLRSALESLREARFALHYTIYLSTLAQGLGVAGQMAKAHMAIDEALERAESNEEHWCMAELLRIKGDLFRLDGSAGADGMAEDYLLQALDWARRQEALSWELRAALSLAKLWHQDGKTAEADEVLSAVYNRFTEGFETPDLRSASAMLQSLAISSR